MIMFMGFDMLNKLGNTLHSMWITSTACVLLKYNIFVSSYVIFPASGRLSAALLPLTRAKNRND